MLRTESGLAGQVTAGNLTMIRKILIDKNAKLSKSSKYLPVF